MHFFYLYFYYFFKVMMQDSVLENRKPVPNTQLIQENSTHTSLQEIIVTTQQHIQREETAESVYFIAPSIQNIKSQNQSGGSKSNKNSFNHRQQALLLKISQLEKYISSKDLEIDQLKHDTAAKIIQKNKDHQAQINKLRENCQSLKTQNKRHLKKIDQFQRKKSEQINMERQKHQKLINKLRENCQSLKTQNKRYRQKCDFHQIKEQEHLNKERSNRKLLRKKSSTDKWQRDNKKNEIAQIKKNYQEEIVKLQAQKKKLTNYLGKRDKHIGQMMFQLDSIQRKLKQEKEKLEDLQQKKMDLQIQQKQTQIQMEVYRSDIKDLKKESKERDEEFQNRLRVYQNKLLDLRQRLTQSEGRIQNLRRQALDDTKRYFNIIKQFGEMEMKKKFEMTPIVDGNFRVLFNDEQEQDEQDEQDQQGEQ